ncbi:metal-dependent hydrolase family protein [Streptomyces xanthophaeus]|uniref:metal-dependent hydrolase family protein n=1 Tax=Streptomyces xanthophaeus TaxID=67385 RepID=UPI00264812D0|nr:amidohydrolase family protein [Streptomyces xanthophaeus]WKD32301.1 amidohydrolase family protein [Streptomyces xanthophaeus]
MKAYYTAKWLITGGPGGRIRDGGVLVDRGTIRWVGSDDDLPARLRRGSERVDLGSMTLLPGLVDSHVHLALDGLPGAMDRMRALDDAPLRALMFRNAAQLLAAGVTTARDLGAPGHLALHVRDALRAGRAPGPSLVVSGPPLTVPGGHCWFMGGACADEAELRAAVRAQAARGVDFIKVMATGGALTGGSGPGEEQFGEAELRAVVDEATLHGLRVAAHAHGTSGIAHALRAGVHTIEHCSFISPEGTIAPDLSLVRELAAAPVHVCPTISRRFTERWDDRDDPRSTPVSALPLLHREGVALIAGTDAGTDGAPHPAYADGLVGMARLGIPAADILHTATAGAARALGLGAVTGRLAPGLRADLIAVDGDPLDDIAVLAAPRLVVARGRQAVSTGTREGEGGLLPRPV